MASHTPEYENNLRREIAHIAALLAGGAYFRNVGEWNDVELVAGYRFDRAAFNHMLHHGWLVSTTGCGGFELSDAGRAAYIRSTDELGDGKLVDPSPEYQP